MPQYNWNCPPRNNVYTCSETVVTSCQPMPWNIPRRLKASYQIFSIQGITAKILYHMFCLHISSPKQNLKITKIMGLSTETAKKFKMHRTFMLYNESELEAQYFMPCGYRQLQFLIIKPNRCINFSNLFLELKSTCFRQFPCQSSGVFHCADSNGICHTGLLTACEQDQGGTPSIQ